MYLAIIKVVPLKDYKLLLTFENNEERVFNVKPLMKIGAFQELENPALFNSVRVSFDSIEWANELDLDPEYLYDDSLKIEKNSLL